MEWIWWPGTVFDKGNTRRATGCSKRISNFMDRARKRVVWRYNIAPWISNKPSTRPSTTTALTYSRHSVIVDRLGRNILSRLFRIAGTSTICTICVLQAHQVYEQGLHHPLSDCCEDRIGVKVCHKVDILIPSIDYIYEAIRSLGLISKTQLGLLFRGEHCAGGEIFIDVLSPKL